MPLFLYSHCPNQFRYPVCGQEPSSLTHRHGRLLTQKRIFSPAYYIAVGTSANAVKCYIISDSSLFIPTIKAQCSLLKRLLTYTASYGKIVTLTVQPVITYVYLCVSDGMHPVYISFQTVVQ